MRRSLSRFRLPVRPLRHLVLLLAGVLSALLLAPGFFSSAPAAAQQSGYGQTMGSSAPERQFYDYGPSSGSSAGGSGNGSLLNSTNPMELMNKLRKSTALDDATPPTSAVDQALKGLEAQMAGASARGPAQTVKGP